MAKEEIFFKYQDLVHGALHTHFGDTHTINQKFSYFGITYDDLAQIGFLYLWRVIDQLDDDIKPSTYIYKGVHYAVISYLKKECTLIKWLPMNEKYKRYWHSYNVPLPDSEKELIDVIPSHDNHFKEIDNRVLIEHMTETMNDEDREVIHYFLSDIPKKDIAKIKGITQSAVSQRFRRITKTLQKEFSV